MNQISRENSQISSEKKALMKKLADKSKQLLIAQGQMSLKVDQWKQKTMHSKSEVEELTQNLAQTRQHYESIVQNLKTQIKDSKSRQSEQHTETGENIC